MGAGTGKATPDKITLNFVKNDPTILTLKTLLLKGPATGNAYIIFSKAGGTTKPASPQSDYYYIKLTNYHVIEVVETAENTGSSPVQVSFGFSALSWSVKPQLLSGAFGTAVSEGWDFAKNIEVTTSAVPPTSLGSF